jgi:hypothetical protein
MRIRAQRHHASWRHRGRFHRRDYEQQRNYREFLYLLMARPLTERPEYATHEGRA